MDVETLLTIVENWLPVFVAVVGMISTVVVAIRKCKEQVLETKKVCNDTYDIRKDNISLRRENRILCNENKRLNQELLELKKKQLRGYYNGKSTN